MNIQAIHQIEITSRCNLACRYCAHPKMTRAKVDMDAETYERALYWAARFVKAGTQGELNLAGIGESTMHPDFASYVIRAREAVGSGCRITLATNGLLMTEELAELLGDYNVHTWVSLHRPEKAGPAVVLLKKYNILYGTSSDPSVSAIDWAGQVDWFVSAELEDNRCFWVLDARVFVLSDGRVTRCCLDAEGQGLLGTVEDSLDKFITSEYSLCAACHLDPRVALQEVG